MIKFLTKKKVIGALGLTAVGVAGVVLWKLKGEEEIQVTIDDSEIPQQKERNFFNKYSDDGAVDPSDSF